MHLYLWDLENWNAASNTKTKLLVDYMLEMPFLRKKNALFTEWIETALE